MSATEARYHLLRLKRKYTLLRATEVMLLALAAGLITFAVAYGFVLPIAMVWLLAGAAGAVCFVVRSMQLDLWKISEAGVVHYMNQHYPQLEESADLFMREDEGLTSLQQLQKIKSLKQFEALYPSVKLPHKLLQAFGIFACSVLTFFALMGFAGRHNVTKESTNIPNDVQTTTAPDEVLPASIRSAAITFTPPSYTGIPKQTVKTFNLRVPEGTDVQWNIAFTENVLEAKIIFSTSDSVKLAATGSGEYFIQKPPSTKSPGKTRTAQRNTPTILRWKPFAISRRSSPSKTWINSSH